MTVDHRAEYRAKLRTAAEAVSMIPPRARASMGMALGEPPALLAAIAERVEAGAIEDLAIWYFHSMPYAAETILRYELMDRVRPHCMFLGPIERALQARGEEEGRKTIDFVPTAFSDAPELFRRHVELDVFVSTVSPMDRSGFFSFGANNDYATTAARSAARTIVEVNAAMPRAHGDAMLHVSEVDALIENDRPLPEHRSRPPTPVEERIGEIVSELVPDGACLQMGIGALPDAVCAQLAGKRDLGVHTELLSPGLVDLIESGAVTNRRKRTYRGRTVFTFALGDARTFALIDDNPSINSLPVDVVNDPRHIAKNPNVVSINATLQVDLTGACNSENLSGRQYSGSGGQLDFVRGARASAGGRSIIACPSTAGDGSISRIAPTLDGPVTTPRNDVDTIVTEWGAARLIGLSNRERAEALIAIAHPDHRSELRAAVERLRM